MLRLPQLLARFALALAALTSTSSGRADDYSELERRTLERALGPRVLQEPSPGGKTIESVQIIRPEVFDDDDPVPDFVNVFHAQTREHVVRRELLFEPGQVYDSERVEETERNLRLIPQLGVVLIVALPGSAPGRVRVVVIVRDVWSLRLNYELRGGAAGVRYFLLNLSEDNLFGLHARLGALFTLEPDRYAFGGLAAYPKLLDTPLDAFAYGGVYVNRDSGQSEGSFGTLSLRKDLRSLADEWAFLAGAAWLVEQTRSFRDVQQRTFDDPATTAVEAIPIEYHTKIARGGAEVTRSFGRRNKTDVTFGVEINQRQYRAAQLADAPAEVRERFLASEVPVSDTRVSPFVQLRATTSRYLKARDVETLSLQESFSLGPFSALRLYPALRDAGSSRDLLGAISWLGYTWPLDGGLLRVVGSSSIEYADRGRHQATAQGGLRAVSPRLGFGRFVLDAVAVSTHENYLNRQLALGGDGRPRGYPEGLFHGQSAAAGSLEFRTSAINILSARVGLVAFYDLGGAGEELGSELLHQSLGAGVRILFPQLNRKVFRLDWGAPLTPVRRYAERPLPGAIYFTFGQAFDMPFLKLPELLGAETTLLSQAR